MPEIILHGVSSFLGKHFAKFLNAHNIHFTVLARHSSNISFLENCQNISIIRYHKSLNEIQGIDFPMSTFFEFSWHGVFGTERNDPAQLSVNVPLIISSIELAHAIHSRHWVGIGSQAEYGNLDKHITETDSCHPTTLYGKSKLICSNLSAELCNAYQIEHSWLRLFSVYGPDDNHEWLIQYLIKKMLRNEVIDVTKGEQIWDYLYVEDISEVLFKISTLNGVGIANLGSGSGIQVKAIINLIKEKTGSSSAINFGAVPYRPDQVMEMKADISKLASHTGWNPKTSFESGIQKTIDFMKIKEINS